MVIWHQMPRSTNASLFLMKHSECQIYLSFRFFQFDFASGSKKATRSHAPRGNNGCERSEGGKRRSAGAGVAHLRSSVSTSQLRERAFLVPCTHAARPFRVFWLDSSSVARFKRCTKFRRMKKMKLMKLIILQ